VSARPAASTRPRRSSTARPPQRCIRAPKSLTAAFNSASTGVATSAAAVGVGARRSETKSMSVVSVSWPTALISGIVQAATVRASASSLNGQRSSTEPPPRATISTSGRGIAPPASRASKPRIAAATWAAAASPCTTTGQTMTRHGQRSRMRCRMSRITAPVGLVITPTTAGIEGRGCFRSGANRPSAASRPFSRSS